MTPDRSELVVLVPNEDRCGVEVPAEVTAFVERTKTDPVLTARLLRIVDALEPAPRFRRGYFVVASLAAAVVLAVWLSHPRSVTPPVTEPTVSAPDVAVVAPPREIAPTDPVVVQTSPEPGRVETPLFESPVRELSLDVASKGAPRLVTVVTGVTATLQGTLHVRGIPRQPRILLDGSVTFDVVPGAVDDLIVETDAATARVLGTRFEVNDESTGTTVKVERGKVEVSCKAGVPTPASVVLGEAGSRACPPPNAAGLLVYARQRQTQGASPVEILEVADRGLEYPVKQPSLHDTLRVMRMESLFALGQREKVQEEAMAYLASDATILRDEVRALADSAAERKRREKP